MVRAWSTFAGALQTPSPLGLSCLGVVGEQDDLKRRMDEYMVHEDYHESIRGQDGEEPIKRLGSPPQTDMDSYYYSGPPTDLADTALLPRCPRGTPWPTFTTPPCEEPTWRPETPATTRTKDAYPAYMEGSHCLGPAYGTLDRTAELLAKLSSVSEHQDAGALSEAVRLSLRGKGITEPQTKPAMAAPSRGLTSLSDDLKRSRVSRSLPKVTCPGPFHPRARTVPIAELQDVPLTEARKKELTALAPLAGRLAPPTDPTSGSGKIGKPIAQVNIQQELPESDPKYLPEWAEEVAEFRLLTGQSHVDVATKCSLLKRACKKKFLQKHVNQIGKTIQLEVRFSKD